MEGRRARTKEEDDMRARKLSLAAVAASAVLSAAACGREGIAPPTAPVPPAPPAFAVTSVAANASPGVSGCHRTLFNFAGSITVNAAGEVRYRWVGSDGGMTAEESVRFDGAGTRLVATSWELSTPGTHWQALRVLSPNAVDSNRATITIACP
jgi:hypothetical protein